MRSIFSTRYSAVAFNIATLVLRVGLAALIIPGGFYKLTHFNDPKFVDMMINFMGIGKEMSLALVIFAEFFCAILVILGVMTRLAVIPLIIAMVVAVVVAHKGQVFGEGSHAALFAVGFITVFLLGPGRISVDGLISK